MTRLWQYLKRNRATFAFLIAVALYAWVNRRYLLPAPAPEPQPPGASGIGLFD